MFENNCLFAVKIMSWSSSVSIVSDYRLYDLGLIPGKAKDFSSSLIVQTSSEVHPVSYRMGTGASFPGVKDPGKGPGAGHCSATLFILSTIKTYGDVATLT
jgi:hypothetical protein